MVRTLSIIVPVLNEIDVLPAFGADLSAQRDCVFEVIFCDGGSQDGSLAFLQRFAATVDFSVRVVSSAAGRGRQMNAGARRATGHDLLFLHADSLLPDPRSLAESLAFFRRESERRGHHRLAGHFALRFFPKPLRQRWAYFVLEEKARLNLPGCVHGDQGMLLARRFFEDVGPFDEDLPFFEDEKLATEVSARGDWLLLPVEIYTSARRFEQEGLRARQLLNALLMNFHHIGWTQYLRQVPGIYRQQKKTAQLDLLPFFEQVEMLLNTLPKQEQRRLWLDTGQYVRSQAWQLPFAFLTLVRYLLKRPRRRKPWGHGFCSQWERLTDRLPFNRLTAIGVRWWFKRTLAHLRRR